MKVNRPKQKLVAFSKNSPEQEEVKQDLSKGWMFTSLVNNGSFFVGIMEDSSNSLNEEGSIFIPPRKKIKIYSSNSNLI